MSALYVIGDIHGHYRRMVTLLKETGLVDGRMSWCGGDKTLVFMGDYTDRGPDGYSVISLVMRLQREAADAGGRVLALLGNHDVMILAAHHFGAYRPPGYRRGFLHEWQMVGGVSTDLERLTPAHVQWLQSLPALIRLGDRLFAHADALFYVSYGRSLETVNTRIGEVLDSDDPVLWAHLLDQFAERFAFTERDRAGGRREDGPLRARTFLHIFDAEQLVHAHTPIPAVTGMPPEQVEEPFIYAEGQCINVDGGIYMGSPGFVYQLG